MAPPSSLLDFGKNISGATNRDHPARLFRVVLDGGADTRNMHVYGAVKGFEPFVAELVHDRIARHDPASIASEQQEQGELVAGERARFASEPHLMGADIDLEAAEPQNLCGSRVGNRPPQDRLEPRQ